MVKNLLENVGLVSLKNPWYCWGVESGVRGLSDLRSNRSWLMGWDYTHSRSPRCDPFLDRIANFWLFSSALNNWNSKRYQRLQTWQILRVRVVLEPAEALDPRHWPKGLQVWGRKLIIYGLKLQRRMPLYIPLPCHLRWWKMAPIIMLIAYYIRFEFILFQSAVWPFVCVLSLSVSTVYFDNFHFWVWWAPWKL